jgi:2-haloacid dehalogenase
VARDRWATFDCYGTLIDWDRGIGETLGRLFGAERRPELLRLYHELEPALELEDPSRSYREIMRLAVERIAREEGAALAERDFEALGDSLPEWPAFPEVPPALERTRTAGWKLAILSNTDRDLIEASTGRIGVPFELAIVASEIGSYKPGRRHWSVFRDRTGIDPARHVHVAASLYHDVEPALALDLLVVWINRLGERADPEPTRELPDLSRLPETLDELVPA